MNVQEAARRIGVSRSKLYQLVASRRIAHYRVGAKILFADEDIRAYVNACRINPEPPALPLRSAVPQSPLLRHLKPQR
jgi:excisionase family DNA binding protein